MIVAHANIARFVDYTAILTLRDLVGGLAGGRTFTANLQSFAGQVIIFAAGHDFETGMVDTSRLMTSARVSLNYKEAYGHVDYVFSRNHLRELEHPILKWLQDKVFKKH